jgi:hypothetical protein
VYAEEINNTLMEGSLSGIGVMLKSRESARTFWAPKFSRVAFRIPPNRSTRYVTIQFRAKERGPCECKNVRHARTECQPWYEAEAVMSIRISEILHQKFREPRLRNRTNAFRYRFGDVSSVRVLSQRASAGSTPTGGSCSV